MPKEIIFPKVDMDMESGLLSEWLCANGDSVTEGQPIFIIETDKSAMEIESVASGKIDIVESATGDHYPVGQVMAYIYESHEAYDESAGKSSANEPASASRSASDSSAANNRSSNDEIPADAANAGKDESVQLSASQSGKPVFETVGSDGSDGSDGTSGRVRASPAARRLAAEKGINLADVAGSARKGRIVRADVAAFVGRVSNPSLTGQPLVAQGLAQPAAVQRIPHSGMRRTIASRLTQATQDIPSYQIVVECQCESVLRTADELNRGIEKGLAGAVDQRKVSLNVFFIKALAMALRDFPVANSQWTDNERLLFSTVDIGMAVALDDGLITPIVKSAESKSVLQIASDTQSLIQRAREGSLAKADYQGGVSTVSNLGMFGVKEFTSIINPPQASIISVGAVEQAATVIDSQLQIKPLCRVTFTFDHRLIDGAVGAQLASRFKEYIENSVQLLL